MKKRKLHEYETIDENNQMLPEGLSFQYSSMKKNEIIQLLQLDINGSTPNNTTIPNTTSINEDTNKKIKMILIDSSKLLKGNLTIAMRKIKRNQTSETYPINSYFYKTISAELDTPGACLDLVPVYPHLDDGKTKTLVLLSPWVTCVLKLHSCLAT
jgi:hypothetical protein